MLFLIAPQDYEGSQRIPSFRPGSVKQQDGNAWRTFSYHWASHHLYKIAG